MGVILNIFIYKSYLRNKNLDGIAFLPAGHYVLRFSKVDPDVCYQVPCIAHRPSPAKLRGNDGNSHYRAAPPIESLIQVNGYKESVI